MQSSIHLQTFDEAIVNKDNINVFKRVFNRFQSNLPYKDFYKEIFYRSILKSVKSFNPDKKKKFTSHLYRVAYCSCIDELRLEITKKKIPTIQGDFTYHTYYDEKSESLVVEVKDCLESMIDDYKTIIKMKYYGNYSLEEIADFLSIDKKTAKILITNAETQFKEIYQQG